MLSKKKAGAVGVAIAALMGLLITPPAQAETPSGALGDPNTLMASIAPDRLTPTPGDATVGLADHAGALARETGAVASSISVHSEALDQTTNLSLDPNLESTGKVGDFDTFQTADRQLSASIKPAVLGAQVVFAVGNSSHLGDMKIQLPIQEVEHQEDGSIYLTLDDGSVLYMYVPWARDASGRALDTHYVVKDNTLSQVIDDASNVAYPLLASPTWFYEVDYSIGNTTPEKARDAMHTCFNCYFPVAGAPQYFPSPGQDLPLSALGGNFHCTFRNEDYRPIPGHHAWGFIFDAASGHVDGVGSWISFDTFQKSGESTYSLRVHAEIVNSNPLGLPQKAYVAGAILNWSDFATALTNIP